MMNQEKVKQLEARLRCLRQQVFCGDEAHEQRCIEEIEAIKKRLEPVWRERYVKHMTRRLEVYFL